MITKEETEVREYREKTKQPEKAVGINYLGDPHEDRIETDEDGSEECDGG